MSRFINDDVKLKNGGRKAVQTEHEELWDKIVKRAQKVSEEEVNDCDMDDEDAYSVIEQLLYNDENIRKDIKFEVDFENITMDYCFGTNIKGTPLVGFHTLSNRFSFLGVEIGGDGEYPIFIVLYFDGKKIRAYTPSYGNCVNLDFKTALGAEDYVEPDVIDKIKEKYKKQGIIFEEDEYGYIDWKQVYCEKYELDYSDIGYNWIAIKKDIVARIEVV